MQRQNNSAAAFLPRIKFNIHIAAAANPGPHNFKNEKSGLFRNFWEFSRRALKYNTAPKSRWKWLQINIPKKRQQRIKK